MLDMIFILIGCLIVLYVLSTILLVIVQTIIEKFNDSDIKLNKKTERLIVISITIMMFLILVFCEWNSNKRENKIKEIINDSESITEIKDTLIEEGIFKYI